MDYMFSKLDDMDKKRRETTIGLLNNATGAGFGVIATGQAAAAARSKYKRLKKDPNAPEPPKKPSPVVRGAKWAAKKYPKTVGRAAAAAKPRLTGKNAAKGALVLGTANVAGQFANAALDGQSTAYFARERKNLSRPKKKDTVVKSDNGMTVGYEMVDKAQRWESRWQPMDENRKKQMLNTAAGAGYVAGAGSVGYGLNNAVRNVAQVDTRKNRRARPGSTKWENWQTMPTRKKRVTRSPQYVHTDPLTLGDAVRNAKSNFKATRGTRKVMLPVALGTSTLGAAYAAQKKAKQPKEKSWH